MKATLIAFLLMVLCSFANAQQTVTFKSTDDIMVTADLYMVDVNYPYILLLHQAGYSRGEYREIAPKLANLGYNCLAIDQRSGDEVNFVKNATAALAKEKNLTTAYIDALPDIKAAVDFIKTKSNNPIVIWGSSYSASLALVVASSDLRIGAVVAFSPGEYFDDNNYVKNNASKISVPVFVTSAKSECQATNQTCSTIKPDLLTLYCPQSEGIHGSRALWKANQSNDEYWLALSMFFSKM